MSKVKIKVVCDEQNREDIERMLEAGGFVLCDDGADLILTESGAFLSAITARTQDGERIIVQTDNIEYFESFGHDIVLITTENEQLRTSEKMYELEALLPPVFVRIGQSVIVHKKYIKKILPSLFQRFDVIMVSGARLRVTRGYYSRFRETLGI